MSFKKNSPFFLVKNPLNCSKSAIISFSNFQINILNPIFAVQNFECLGSCRHETTSKKGEIFLFFNHLN